MILRTGRRIPYTPRQRRQILAHLPFHDVELNEIDQFNNLLIGNNNQILQGQNINQVIPILPNMAQQNNPIQGDLRHVKLTPFDGTQDPAGFIERLDAVRQAEGWNNESCILALQCLLQGVGEAWWSSIPVATKKLKKRLECCRSSIQTKVPECPR